MGNKAYVISNLDQALWKTLQLLNLRGNVTSLVADL